MIDYKNIVDTLHQRNYFNPKVLSAYASYDLTRMEIITLLKYQSYFVNKDILDIGLGTGRTTVYLAQFARRYEGIDFSPAMIEYVHSTMPQISANIGDMRNLSNFKDSEFDFVFASNNVVDETTMQDRLQTLSEVYRVLRSEGLFVFSSHNHGYQHAGVGPKLILSKNPIRQLRLFFEWFQRLLNHARVKKFRLIKEDYAMFNDAGHDFSSLHLYISQTLQRKQLSESGFVVLDVFDIFGNLIAETDDPVHSPHLMYVAQKEK
jgi:SAM-dependent methyltransferase